jgi:hypothetical protein
MRLAATLNLSIKAKQPKKRHYESLIKATERMCCISSVPDFLLTLASRQKWKNIIKKEE